MRKFFLIFIGFFALIFVVFYIATYDKPSRTVFMLQQLSLILSESNIEVVRDQSYGPHARQKLDIYNPKTYRRTLNQKNETNSTSQDSGPIVIYFYGGSWKSGSKDLYHFLGAAFASRGITTVVPDYRVYPEVMFPTFVEDAAQAYAWVWRNFIKDKNPNRKIILIGHSAGAHIAALLSLNSDYLRNAESGMALPNGFIGLAGPYAFNPTTYRTTRRIFANVKRADEARPVTFAHKDAPPSLLFHGRNDMVVKLWNTEELAAALNKAGAQSKKVELPNVGHIGIVLTIAKPFRWRASVLDDMVTFIRTQK